MKNPGACGVLRVLSFNYLKVLGRKVTGTISIEDSATVQGSKMDSISALVSLSLTVVRFSSGRRAIDGEIFTSFLIYKHPIILSLRQYIKKIMIL